MAITDLVSLLGPEIHDPNSETFLLFSQSLPSQNLGFIDAKAKTIDLTISGRDLSITQSPGLLSSNREGGTTGAVVWKITPLVAEWLTSGENVLFDSGVLKGDSQVLELGCGISGILPVNLAPRIGRYVATDQEYVFKLLKQNIVENTRLQKPCIKTKSHGRTSVGKGTKVTDDNVEILALDWETSSISGLPALIGSKPDRENTIVNAIIACDCIYNEALIEPFVSTCSEICGLAPVNEPTICIVAQQLRSDIVFEAWLSCFHKDFRVWRISDESLTEGLREGSGFVVHIGILREMKL